MTVHIAVASGAGRYADPWHPFAETSACVADVLAGPGRDVTVRDDVDALLRNLADVDLLVLNIGATGTRDAEGRVVGADGEDEADTASRRGLLAHLRGGRPILALHVAATSLSGTPEWEDILGGTWVRGTTMHPPQSTAHVHVDRGAHTVTDGVDDFDVFDERYTFLRVAPTVSRLAWHAYEDTAQPLMWAHAWHGARVVYDALGHDRRSFDAPGHRTLLRRAADWLLAG